MNKFIAINPGKSHRIRWFFLITLLLIGASTRVDASQIVLHVSSKGSDSGNGTQGSPFKDVRQARNKIRALKKAGRQGPFTVLIHEGVYQVKGSILFRRIDSGTPDSPVTYSAAAGERASFFGGRIIDRDWFEPVTDRVFLSRLVDDSIRRDILVADLKGHGITDYGQITRHGWSMEPKDRVPPVSLFIAGQRMTLARWPDKDQHSDYMVYEHYLPEKRPLKGYEKIVQSIIDKSRLPGFVTLTKVIDPGESYAKTQNFNGHGGTFQVAFDRMKYWHDIKNVFLDGVLSSTWEWTYNQLESVDVAKKQITLAGPELNGIAQGESVRLPHFYFENIPEELDSPGEYYIDRKKGLLYLYPPEQFEGPIALSYLAEPMISVQDASDIRFVDLEFDTGRNLAIDIRNSSGITVDNCRLANFTKGGIEVDAKDVRVINSQISGMGGFGVHLSGGDLETLDPAGNEVLNCHIHDFGWEQKSQLPGVMVDGVGHRIANCQIHDGSHFAIRIRQANDVTVELNEIYDLPKYHKFDGGSIYIGTGGRAESRGIVVRDNYFHDIPTIGVYPDNFSWGAMIYRNIFRNVGVTADRPAVMVNGGGECRTYNNIMIDCVQMYGQGVRPKDEKWLERWGETIEKYGDGKVDETPYRKYSDFKVWLRKKEPDEFYRPISYVYGNVLFHPEHKILPAADRYGIKDNSKTLSVRNNLATKTDPGFVNYRTGDLRLKKNAEVFKQVPGFKPIPFEKMGRQPIRMP